MKHTFVIVGILALTVLSCSNVGEGGWPPIKLDKYEVSFGAEGGEDMISASNYPEILVSDLMNMANGEHGLQTEYGKTASLDGVELETEGNRMTIRVSASEESHTWKIVLWHYDAISQPIYVYQNH
jgi:hypothetical protein